MGARGCNPPGPPDETNNRRPGLEHIEAFCRYYQRSPEDLGLIKWRDEPTDQEPTGDATTAGAPDEPDDPHPATHSTDDDPAHPQLVVVWVHHRLDSETPARAARVLRILSQDHPGDTAEATD